MLNRKVWNETELYIKFYTANLLDGQVSYGLYSRRGSIIAKVVSSPQIHRRR